MAAHYQYRTKLYHDRTDARTGQPPSTGNVLKIELKNIMYITSYAFLHSEWAFTVRQSRDGTGQHVECTATPKNDTVVLTVIRGGVVPLDWGPDSTMNRGPRRPRRLENKNSRILSLFCNNYYYRFSWGKNKTQCKAFVVTF